MIEKLITLKQLKEITEQLKARLDNKVDANNDAEFNQKIIVEFEELNNDYEDIRKEDFTEENYDPSVKNYDFSIFYDFKYDIYESLNYIRIQKLFDEIEKKSTSDSFEALIENIVNFSNHDRDLIREMTKNLLKNKNLTATVNYLISISEIDHGKFVNTFFNLDINNEDWENHLKNYQNWSPFVNALKKVADMDKNLIDENLFGNNNLYFMNVIRNFAYFIPQEMALLENEIINYLDINRYGHRSFECALYSFESFYAELKTYFSEAGKEKMKTIIHQVAKEEYGIDDIWVTQNVLPSLKIVGENDSDCQATIALISAFEIAREEYSDTENIDETNYNDIIGFCENYLTGKSPETDKEEYYHCIHQLLQAHIQYAEQIYYNGGKGIDIYNMLEKATDYTQKYYSANFKLEQDLIDHFFNVLYSLQLDIEDEDIDEDNVMFLEKIKALHTRFSKI